MATTLWTGHRSGRASGSGEHCRAREVVTRSGGIMRGKFPSRKIGRMVHHEGLLELDAIYLLEASPQVASYREQPAQIFYPDGDQVRRYTPDFEATLGDGRQVWIEVKPISSLSHEDVQHKLDCVARHLERSDQPFVILTDEVLRQEPRQSNIRMLFHRAARCESTRASGRHPIKRRLNDFPATLGRATEQLRLMGTNPYSLLLAGVLRCSLDKPLSNDTLLTVATEADDGWFWLSKAHGF